MIAKGSPKLEIIMTYMK